MLSVLALMRRAGIKSPNDFVFDKLPLRKGSSKLGNNKEVLAYYFRLDKLILGKKDLIYSPIVLSNISVKIIYAEDSEFVVGWNVLKYLNISYWPSKQSAEYRFTLTNSGREYMEYERTNNNINNLSSRFMYLSADPIDTLNDKPPGKTVHFFTNPDGSAKREKVMR